MKNFIIFVLKCLAVVSLSLLLLFILNRRYLTVMGNPYSDTDKFNYMGSVYNTIQIANIGSSHGEYGFYYEELSKQQGYECFNFAMASQTYNYDYGLLSSYKDYFADESFLFIPISYFSFNNEVTNEAESQSLSTKYYTFLPPKNIPDYNPYIDLVTHIFPILSAKDDIWKILPSFSMQVFAAEGDYTPTPEEFTEKGLSRYKRHVAEKEEPFMQERIDELYQILDFCKDQNITPVLISTPYTPYYFSLVSDEFKSQFRSIIEEISYNSGVSYYDFSEDSRFGDNLAFFADADHLDTEGAISFMDVIKNEIPEYREFLERVAPIHKGDANWQPPY